MTRERAKPKSRRATDKKTLHEMVVRRLARYIEKGERNTGKTSGIGLRGENGKWKGV